jgi:hypothetical protein
MKISIMGCGWYGLELARHLPTYDLRGSTTTPEKIPELKKIGVTPYLFKEGLPPLELIDVDCLILNIPPRASQLEWFQSWPLKKETWIIFISSTSGNKILVEEEEWIQKNFPYWTILRFGGLIGGSRHPGKVLSGRENILGRIAPVNLIHREDCVDFTKIVIEKKLQHKIFNVVSDEHSTKEEFYSEFATRKNLPLPLFDKNDKDTGRIIDNSEMKKFYVLKWPRMIGKET